MQRYLDELITADLERKMVFVTGPRQVGKTTLSQALVAKLGGQSLNYDVPEDRAILLNQRWNARAPLLVFDEIHKMPGWKAWLKGVYDGKPPQQQILVTGSARLDTFRAGGESLAGRFAAWRLHPVSVREWQAHQTLVGGDASADAALAHLLNRGGFPEPCLESAGPDGDTQAERWRRQYFDGVVRDDVLEFSRVKEVQGIRLFAQLLRQRVGSPISLASMGRDLGLSPATLRRYLEILEALYIVFVVRPWHHNIARATLQAPKVYFFDTGLVGSSTGGTPEADGLRFENLVACHLLKQVQWLTDAKGREAGLHYIRTKDGAEVDFAISDGMQLTHLVECKLADARPCRALLRFAGEHPQAKAVQLLRDLRHPHEVGPVSVERAGEWLAGLDV
jgi:predicted AAA+ superfamily ATPase